MKRLIIALLTLSLATALSACGTSGDTTEPTVLTPALEATITPSPATAEADVGDYTLAYITPSLDVPFWCYMTTGVETQAATYTSTVLVYDSENDAALQLQNMTNAIGQGVDAIIISPVDSTSCGEALNLAEAAGIPVVVCDVGTDSGTYVSYISSDNEGGAKELGDYMAGLLEKNAFVAQITLDQGRINGQLRKSGFELGIANNSLVQVDDKEMTMHIYDEGYTLTQELLSAHPELTAIFVHAEDPTLGAIDALADAGRSDILVAGFDFSEAYPDAMRAGQMVATAAQQPVLMGNTAVDQVMRALSGKATAAEISLPTLLITQDNIDELEASGGLDTVFVAS